MGYKKIVNKVKEEDNIQLSLTGVKKVWKKFNETGDVGNRPRFEGTRNPQAKLGTQEHEDFVNTCMREIPDLSAKQLARKLLDEFGIEISVSKTSKYRQHLGWKQGRTRYCQMIRDVNKVKRQEWCEEQIRTGEQFEDVIFTDESRIEICRMSGKCFMQEGHAAPYQPKPKHPYAVLVWGGISMRGATELIIFHGIMKSPFYRNVILTEGLIPFVQEVYPEHHRLMQDNDPKHTANDTKSFMVEKEINWWQTPPESPDLNPIENLWHEMKQHICSKVKPTTKDELVDGIEEFWSTVTREKCQKYIGHIHKVIPKVIEANGCPCGE